MASSSDGVRGISDVSAPVMLQVRRMACDRSTVTLPPVCSTSMTFPVVRNSWTRVMGVWDSVMRCRNRAVTGYKTSPRPPVEQQILGRAVDGQ